MKYINKIMGGSKRAVASAVLAGSIALGLGCSSGCAKSKTINLAPGGGLAIGLNPGLAI